ncbi:hypothetical protein M6B38_286835 [Iris pallida]|uniref:Uncharacterized protein n=1 Tax=Iris pallida TaxID=29817 RepID=A0AAX6HWI6_IRIPA|nr:hypothetical protein M6B38_286835 [Iris pallida]
MNFAGSVCVLHQSSGTAAELENIMLILLQLVFYVYLAGIYWIPSSLLKNRK